MFATTILSNISILKEPSKNAPLIDEILFGEVVEYTHLSNGFTKVKHQWNQTEGFVLSNQLTYVSEEYAQTFANGQFLRLFSSTLDIENQRSSIKQFVPVGAIFNLKGDEIHIGDEIFAVDSNCPNLYHTKSEDKIRDAALLYLNVPEKNGARTNYGIDPQLFITQIFAFANIYIGHSLDQMIAQGTLIDFTHEIKCGDIAFFENESNQIIHAGICIGENWILHCDGKVKTGRLDQQGLFDPKENGYIYNLRLIKRYF